MVTMRRPEDALWRAVVQAAETGPAPKSLLRIGDCLGPGTIAAAVYSGHRYARELGEPEADGVPFRRELPALAPD
jgi:dimethylamine/trimethylamine dehydrogenase